jgi:GGDEF domain-containing protein
VADERSTHHLPRARAVAELASETSSERGEELARRWAIALIHARPLQELGELPLEELSRAAPALCAQALRAVQSDLELERLAGRSGSSAREQAGDARGLAAMCGAREPAALVEAVEALRGVLWEALFGELREPSARLLAEVGDRLAYVCATLLAAGVRAIASGLETEAPGADARAPEPASRVPVVRDLASGSRPRGEVVLVDERAPADEVSQSLTPAPPARAAAVSEHAQPWGEPRSALPGEPPAEIEIRDQRREEGPGAWISSIGAQLERFERDGAPFAVLLVELVDIERLRRDGPPEQLTRLASELERALAAASESWSGSVARERPGRCWLLAPGTDRAGAERLAQRLMRELSASGGERRPSLAVAIGTAICPEDGREPAALAAHADIGLYAARSALRASLSRFAAPLDDRA